MYITELSDTDAESYDQFKQRILANEIVVSNGSVKYTSSGREFYVNYDQIFRINGEDQDTEYKRYDSKYSVTERGPDAIFIKCGRNSLRLNYEQIERTESSGNEEVDE